MHPWRPLGLEAQILFHTAGSEGIPTVALEAMSLGIPFVGTTAGATEEAILHNKTGLLAAVDDEDALYAILRRAIEEPEERLKLGSAGRNRGLNTFRFDSHVSNLLDAYRELCSATTGNTLATEISQVLSATVRLR
jgi:glycosyltransferase involved in cell wall biosynthesis